MNSLEQETRFDEMPDFDLGFDMDGFDINTAFQEAMTGVVTDAELALEEKVRRMEVIVSEGSSDVYRDFVDFRMMATQIEMMCSHDHVLSQSLQNSTTLSGFMDSHKNDDGHNHSESLHDRLEHKHEDEKDPKKSKKKKKRTGWFSLLMKT